MKLTAEQRYRQACTKAQIECARNIRLWLRDELECGYLPASHLREYIVQQIDAAYDAGFRDAMTHIERTRRMEEV